MAEIKQTNVTAHVSIGDGKELVIDRNELLWLVDGAKRGRPNMLLGHATKERLTQLIHSFEMIRSVCS